MITSNSRRLRVEERDPDWNQGHGPNRDPQRDRDIVKALVMLFGPYVILALLLWGIFEAATP